MGLYVKLYFTPDTGGKACECPVFEATLTHNLNKMAARAGLYDALWNPTSIKKRHPARASDIIEPLTIGIRWLKENEDEALKYKPKNGFGTLYGLQAFAEDLLKNCKDYPNAKIYVEK